MKHIYLMLISILMVPTLSLSMFSRTSQLSRARAIIKPSPKIAPQVRPYQQLAQQYVTFKRPISPTSLMVIPTSKPEESFTQATTFEKPITTPVTLKSWWEALKDRASKTFTYISARINPTPSNIFPEFFKEGYGNPFKDKTLEDYKKVLEEHKDLINKVDTKYPNVETTLLSALILTLENIIKNGTFDSLEDLIQIVTLARIIQQSGGSAGNILKMYDIYNLMTNDYYQMLLLKFPSQTEQVEQLFQLFDDVMQRIDPSNLQNPVKPLRIVLDRVKTRINTYTALSKEHNLPPLDEQHSLKKKQRSLEEKIKTIKNVPVKKVSPLAKDAYFKLIGLDPKNIYTAKELDATFKAAMKRYHPDINPNKELAAEMTKKINAARDDYILWKQQYEFAEGE